MLAKYNENHAALKKIIPSIKNFNRNLMTKSISNQPIRMTLTKKNKASFNQKNQDH